MQLTLSCPHCLESFESPAVRALDRLTDDGPWQVLGDGQTFEDAIHAAWMTEGGAVCPTCEGKVPLSEEALGQLALEVLGQW